VQETVFEGLGKLLGSPGQTLKQRGAASEARA